MDFAAGFAAGFAYTQKLFGSGGKIGTLKAIVDDGASSLSVVLTSDEKLTEYPYTYSAKKITTSVTTTTTSVDTTTKHTKTWSKSLIDELHDISDKLIAKAVYSDESKGIISHYLDGDNNIIYIDSSYTTEGTEIIEKLLSDTDANAVAIAFAIARNIESVQALTDIKKAYQKGLIDGNGDTTPDYETTDPEPTVNIDNDGDGETSDGTIVDLNKGLWVHYDNAYVHVYFDDYSYDESFSKETLHQEQRICVDIYSTEGALLSSSNAIFKNNVGLYSEHMLETGTYNSTGVVYQEYRIVSVKISKQCVSIKSRIINRDYKTGEIDYDKVGTWLKSISFSSMAGEVGAYSKCTSVKPF